jgi:hypothetical protein
MTAVPRDRALPPARDRALPIDADRLIDLLRADRLIEPDDHGDLAALAHSLAGLFHHRLLPVKQRLRRAWSELAHDGDSPAAASDAQREYAKDLVATLRRLLQRANFVQVPFEELHAAMRLSAAFGVAIDLDLADFEELEAWRRKVTQRTQTVPVFFGLRHEPRAMEVFDRFCVYARFKRASHFAGKKDQGGKLGVVPGGVSLRLFRDVPKNDVEALFPGVRIRMRKFDRALIGVPAVAGALHFLVFKIGASLGALGIALLVFLGLRKEEPELRARAIGAVTGLAVLLAFLFRQWMRFLGRKNLLHRQLAEHLQSRTLDTGVGALLHLLDEAEEEEFAEALLAYVFLVKAKQPLPLEELDQRVEEWLARRVGLDVDFEEDDAAAKLEELGLIERTKEGTIAAIAPRKALDRLEARWREELHPR